MNPSAEIVLQQTISAFSEEFEISLISEYLELLTYFLTHEPVHGVEPAEARFESINPVEVKFPRADFFHALHNVYEPASRCEKFISQEQRLPPKVQNSLSIKDQTIPNDIDFAGFGNARQKYIRPYSTCSTSCLLEGFTFLDYIHDKEMLRYDKEVSDPGIDSVVQEH